MTIIEREGQTEGVSTELVKVNDHWLRLLHRPHHQARAVWFVHGLGDWSDIWRPAFSQSALADWELYATDLPGFGWTRPLQTEATVERFAHWLQGVVSAIVAEKPVVLVGHSLGGAIVTMLAKERPSWLAGFVNVDGNLTEADCSLISAHAAAAPNFGQWFESFSERIYREGVERSVLRRYHSGLLLSHRPTFLTASRSLVQLSQNGSLRQVYSTLSVPRVHFYSTTEFSEASRQF